jgi:hypothetical protein
MRAPALQGEGRSYDLSVPSPRPPTCPRCSYSLKGIRDAVCPECGLSLDRAIIRSFHDRPPGMGAHTIILRILTVLALIGVAAAIGDAVTAFGPRPRTQATTVTAIGLCLLPLLFASYWYKNESDIINSRAAMVWTHGVLAVVLGIAGAVLGWWMMH